MDTFVVVAVFGMILVVLISKPPVHQHGRKQYQAHQYGVKKRARYSCLKMCVSPTTAGFQPFSPAEQREHLVRSFL